MEIGEWEALSRTEQLLWMRNATWLDLLELVSEYASADVEYGSYEAVDVHEMIVNGTKGLKNMTREELVEELNSYVNGEPDPERRQRQRLEED